MNNSIAKNLTDTELIILCNDIYDWDHGNGTPNQDSELRKLHIKHEKLFYAIQYLRDDIINEAYNRFHKVAKTLIVSKAGLFIK